MCIKAQEIYLFNRHLRQFTHEVLKFLNLASLKFGVLWREITNKINIFSPDLKIPLHSQCQHFKLWKGTPSYHPPRALVFSFRVCDRTTPMY